MLIIIIVLSLSDWFVYVGMRLGMCSEQENFVSLELKYEGGSCNLMHVFTFLIVIMCDLVKACNCYLCAGDFCT